jgi:hypothetical protein
VLIAKARYTVIATSGLIPFCDREVSVSGSGLKMYPAGWAIGASVKGEELRESFDGHDPLYMYIVSTRIDWGFSAEQR